MYGMPVARSASATTSEPYSGAAGAAPAGRSLSAGAAAPSCVVTGFMVPRCAAAPGRGRSSRSRRNLDQRVELLLRERRARELQVDRILHDDIEPDDPVGIE